MNKVRIQFWGVFLCAHVSLFIQAQGVGIGTTTPQASAKLEVNSTTAGLLPPQMTFAPCNQIATPAQALNTDGSQKAGSKNIVAPVRAIRSY